MLVLSLTWLRLVAAANIDLRTPISGGGHAGSGERN
jgi:hypothetical protein